MQPSPYGLCALWPVFYGLCPTACALSPAARWPEPYGLCLEYPQAVALVQCYDRPLLDLHRLPRLRHRRLHACGRACMHACMHACVRASACARPSSSLNLSCSRRASSSSRSSCLRGACACVHACVRERMPVYMFVCSAHACLPACACVRARACMRACVHMHTGAHVPVCGCISARVHACMCASSDIARGRCSSALGERWISAIGNVCVCVCVCVCSCGGRLAQQAYGTHGLVAWGCAMWERE